MAHISVALVETISDLVLQSLGTPASYHDWHGSRGIPIFGLEFILRNGISG